MAVPDKPSLSLAATVVAVGALVGMAGLVVYMISEASSGEPRWSHLTYVFGAVEAIAFAAAGALFGTSVQRSQTAKAEERADKNQRAAESGQKLAFVLKADRPTSNAGAAGFEALGPEQRAGAEPIAERHAALADLLFPDA